MVVSKAQQNGYIALATLPSRCVCYLDTPKPQHTVTSTPACRPIGLESTFGMAGGQGLKLVCGMSYMIDLAPFGY